jgi:NADH dehydrogenase
MKINRVCILGGSGFVGHHLCARLCASGVSCRIVTRHPQRHRDLKVLPGLELVAGDIFDSKDLELHFRGCEAVVNLVGILNESGAKGQGFRLVHVDLVDRIVEAGRAAGVQRYLHMSALNASASKGSSEYLRSKGEGENQAHTQGHSVMRVTSFRPSVIFGPGDSFFNRFAQLLRMTPGVFPLACPGARMQPVYVGDVVEAFAKALDDPSTWDKHYDLCGPQVFTLAELVRYTARVMGKRTLVVGLGDFVSRMQAHVMGHLPGKPFSYDNYLSLQTDSLCSGDGLAELGIKAQQIETVVPLYLADASERGSYSQRRKALP